MLEATGLQSCFIELQPTALNHYVKVADEGMGDIRQKKLIKERKERWRSKVLIQSS
ncbi:hypothetical protein LguiA_029790 [Lonicera macranthoides]